MQNHLYKAQNNANVSMSIYYTYLGLLPINQIIVTNRNMSPMLHIARVIMPNKDGMPINIIQYTNRPATIVPLIRISLARIRLIGIKPIRSD